MKLRVVSKVLALISGIVALFMLWPLAWALWDGSADVKPFMESVAAGLVFSAALFLLGRDADYADMGVREAFAVVTFSWVVASAVGGLPYLLHGTVPTFTDAFFEAMSGFTTTGASVLSDIEANPRGILFWRDLTHWLGGMGIIVLSLAILPFLGVGGMQLYKAEVPGPIPEKLTPRVQQTALLLWGVYVLMSVVQTILLMLGGMNFFESLTHTFGTVATGGFSPLNKSVGQYNSAYFDWVITIFMFLSGANFTLHYFFLKGKWGAFWKDDEFRFYTFVTVVATLIIVVLLLHAGTYRTVPDALRFAAFQAVSMMTTTGFVTADFETWHFGAQFVLVLLMFLGGCAGSTGGGIKHLRIMILLRHVKMELLRILHPQGIITCRVGGKPLPRDAIASVTAFFILYISVFALATLAMTCLGADIVSAFSGVAATLGNVGPGLGSLGPMDNYSGLPALGKWVLSLCMLLGRLELYTVIMLVFPATWRQ